MTAGHTLAFFQFADGRMRVDLDYAHPVFLERLLALLAELDTLGTQFYVTELYRSWERSAALYTLYKAGGPRAAPAGASAHNYGLAADVCADADPAPGLQLTWNPKRYETLRVLCPVHQLAWGGAFGDRPHIGLPGYESAAQLALIRQQYLAAQGDELARLKNVWQTVVT